MVSGLLIRSLVYSTRGALPRRKNTRHWVGGRCLGWGSVSGLGVGLYFYIFLRVRGILGDIRLWVGDPSTSSCLVSLPAIL